MISTGAASARATAQSDFPVPVGPVRMSNGHPVEPAFPLGGTQRPRRNNWSSCCSDSRVQVGRP